MESNFWFYAGVFGCGFASVALTAALALGMIP